MRILYLVDGLGGGGTERSLAELLPWIASNGWEPEVVCLERRRGAHEALETAGIPVSVLPKGSLVHRCLALGSHLRARRPVLVHTALLRADLLGRVASIGTGARVVASLVSTPYVPVRFRDPTVRPLRLHAARWVDRLTGRLLCDHFHAVSRAARDAAVAALRVPRERITVVPRGRDPERLGEPSPDRRRRVRLSLGIEETAEVVLAVGRHEYQKALPDLVSAVEILARRRPRLVVLIAGRAGTQTPRLEQQMTRGGLEGRVRLLGHREDVPDLLAAADLLAFPSLYEGLPGAVIEAMALAVPVVASDIAPVREVVENEANALLVPPESPAPLAEAIEAMLSDPERASQMGRRGREVFLRRFTLERSVQGMLELYDRLAEGGNGEERPLSPRSAENR